MTNYKIDIVSDTVCPWCYVGKNRLEIAIKQHKARNPTDTFQTTWYPFYLNPEAPQSVDKQQYYEHKFGAQRTRVMQGHLAHLGKQVGINFAFGGKTGNTRDSHRLVQLAKTKGEDMQTKVIEQLFNAYFEENEDITTQEVLIARGVKAGLDEAEVQEWMESGLGGSEVDTEVLEAQEKYISGVPSFTINGKYEVQGAEEPQAFLQVFREVKSIDGDDAPKDQGEDVSSEAPQRRSGSLILYSLEGDEIIPISTTVTPDYSILDIQWYPHETPHNERDAILAVAGSTGRIAFYSLSFTKPDAPQLNLISEKSVTSSEILVLSLCWHPTRDSCLAWTLSDGRVCLCENLSGLIWDSKKELHVVDVQHHSLEAWMVAFKLPGPPSSNADDTTIISGGDDMILQLAHIEKTTNDATILWQDRRIHQAGVTAILPLDSSLVLTGSYDDHIRLLSTPLIGRRQVLAECNLGGGVWRLKMLSDPGLQTKSYVLLASCMHAGARVVRLSHRENSEGQAEWMFEVLARFEEHQSMNYGSDMQPGVADAVKRIVSISFYDKLMCLWKFDPAR
ncbi:WD40 repeat-like protein [Acrodontium crateriforme]|uniref:WD40 repeat-like protein n=1 Tax=Acrodontium crateriforme TaxID=150365 RepID=A0AAQ3R999_9PEZI|nr:WD40 repeat-like protein [Acrodontium crateriforme]